MRLVTKVRIEIKTPNRAKVLVYGIAAAVTMESPHAHWMKVKALGALGPPKTVRIVPADIMPKIGKM